MHSIRNLLLFTLLLTPALAGGCGGRPTLVPVKGKITYGGGDWPQSGRLYFAVEPGAGNRSGVANFDREGNFSATTFHPGDGLLPGEYRVNVECWEVPPSMRASQRPISYVPQRFQSGLSSGFSVRVPADSRQPIELQFDVPKR